MALRLRTGIAYSSLAALAACVSPTLPPHPTPAAPPQPARASPSDAPDASYDWRRLVIVPFGTLLKEIPLSLHEVLLFRDAAHGIDGKEETDCYAIDGTPPQFVGRRPDEYLLCFENDRLTRIEASARLAADSAGTVFAAACAHWLANSTPAAADSDSCEGRDGATEFRARLGGEPAQSSPVLSISVFNVADP
jgi:hypothetical protein